METSATKGKSKTYASTEILKISAVFIAMNLAIVGCWATISLITGTIHSGGPIGLIRHFISAIIG